MKQGWKQFYYSFPVQLLVLHLRSNHVLLALWVLFLMLMSGLLASKLGFQYLLLDPEYLGEVSFWSFYIVGVGFGGFFISWNLTLYLLSAHYFPFLASLAKPFTKFVINNFVLPLSFFLWYAGLIVYFQHYYEGVPLGRAISYSLAVLLGGLSLVSFYSLYFYFTNRDISYYSPLLERALPSPQGKQYKPGRRQVDLDYIKLDANRWRVETYLTERLQPRLVRSVAHYDADMLLSIFRQNHLNALILQLLSMLLLLVMGYQMEVAWMRIPAGASMFILASVVVALVGAAIYWFSEWSVTVILLLLLVINMTTRCDLFNRDNRAYGLDYQKPPVEYSIAQLQSVYQDQRITEDIAATEAILDRWKTRNATPDNPKPKMVVLCVSGGGHKAATWAMQVVQQSDSLLDGRLLDQTVMISGASGGMLGMAYLRELLLQKRMGQSISLYHRQHIDDITQDMINAVAFTMVSSDVFLPWSTFELEGQRYHKDRGYIFEQQLHENTGHLLDKALSDYREPEQQALIPMLYLTPSIINDARRLVISPQGVSFMMMPPIGQRQPNAVEIDAVDFGWMFAEHGADRLRMGSALRMNASYPYVLPNVHLPSEPSLQVVDAGFLDNYGMATATRFIQVFQDWIKANTSGVVLLQISSSQRLEEIGSVGDRGAISSLFHPLGIVGKVMDRQEFEHDTSLGFVHDLLGEDYFQCIRFVYRPAEEGQLEASISLHITEREREDVLRAINLPSNQQALRRLTRELTD